MKGRIKKRRRRRHFEKLEARNLLAYISELMVDNVSSLPDDDGDFSDWFEIHNPSASTVSLNGWYVTDDPQDLTKWQVPDVSISTDERMVVFASGKDRTTVGDRLHTNFQLGSGGEFISLVMPDGQTVAHSFSPYPEQFPDISYGLSAENARGEYYRVATPELTNLVGMQFPQVVINEVHLDTTVKTEHVEFIELYNPSDQVIDISGWTIADALDFTVPANTEIATGEYLVVTQNATAFETKFGFVPLGEWVSGGRLSNDGDDIRIFDSNGSQVDRVQYQLGFPWPTVGDEPSSSMELLHPALDNNLGGSWRSSDPAVTPGAENSTVTTNAAPQFRQVDHFPAEPQSDDDVLITAKVTDPDSVQTVNLEYQIVDPGSYIRITDPAYLANWTTVPMVDDGTGGDLVANDNVYSAILPANLQQHRQLMRYRISASDALSESIVVPYADDPQPNFAYFVYDGVPAWEGASQPGVSPVQTFDSETLNQLPTYHLIARETDVINSQYVRNFDTQHMPGALVYDGVVYDHIEFSNRGEFSTYVSGKNKWRFHFNRGHDFQSRDNYGEKKSAKWRTMNLNAAAAPWVPSNRGMAALEESASFRLHELAGNASPDTSFIHFRVVDDLAEASATDQYASDLWGLYMTLESPDGRYLDERNLPDGDICKVEGGGCDKKNQGPTDPLGSSDWSTFYNAANQNQSVQWWRDNVDLDAYYTFRAINRVTSNVDIREGWNHLFYHNPATDKWVPMPWDLDMMYIAETHWSGTINVKNVLNQSELRVEYQNRSRELLDLLFSDVSDTGGQAVQAVDELAALVNPPGQDLTFVDVDEAMWNHNPRATGSRRGTFYQNPATHGARGGSYTRTLVSADHEGFEQFIKDFLTDTDADGNWNLGDGDTDGYGFNHLESDAADASRIPDRPVIQYVGANGFPVNDLDFQTNAFADPQGNNTFAAMKWRIAEISTPQNASGDGADAWKYEVQSTWESASIDTFDQDVTIPGTVVEIGKTYRARVRMQDDSGRWSHWSEPVEFVSGAPLPTPLSDSIRITEINYNPLDPTATELQAGHSDNDSFEYIEIRNVSGEAINLDGVYFDEGVHFTFGDFLLNSGQYAVVVRDTAAFQARYGSGHLIAGVWDANADGGGFSNGGEHVRLTDSIGTPIHNFVYDDESPWPTRADGFGSSLEVIDVEGDYNDPANWRASSDYSGSPGQPPTSSGDIVINETLSHTDPGQVDSVELYNTTGDDIDIGGWLLSDNLSNLVKYAIPSNTFVLGNGYLVFDEDDFNVSIGVDPRDFALNGAHGDEVVLVETNINGDPIRFVDHVEFGAQANGESWARTPNGSGILYPAINESLDGPNGPPRIGPVVLNEIEYHPIDPGNGILPANLEFIELYNTDTSPINMTNWRLRGGVDFDFADNFMFSDESFLVIVPFDPNDVADAQLLADFRTTYGIDGTVTLVGPFSGQLGNGGEELHLQRPDDSPLDEPDFTPRLLEDRTTYDDVAPWPTTADGLGHSLNRIDYAAIGDYATSWQGFAPSPGTVPAPAVTNVTSPTADGGYTIGGLLEFTIAFSEDIIVDGNPQLSLELGGPVRFADYQSGSGTNVLTLSYEVQSGDISSDLAYSVTNPLILNGGSIKNAALLNASLILAVPGTPNSLSFNKDIEVNAVPPTFAITRDDASPTAADTVVFSVDFSQEVQNVNAADFGLNLAGVAANASVIVGNAGDNDNATYTVTVNSIDGFGTLGLLLAGGNDITNTLGVPAIASPTTDELYSVDTVPPTFAITPADANPTAASSVVFSVDFIRAVQNVDAADFALNLSSVTANATVVVGNAGDNDDSTYTVTVNGISGVGTLGLQIVGGSDITNTLGVPLNTTPTSNLSYSVDTLPPTFIVTRRDANPTSSSQLDFNVDFNRDVINVAAADFGVILDGVTTSNTRTVNDAGDNDDSTYTVTIFAVAGEGTVGLRIIPENNITNTVGTFINTTPTAFEIYTVDTVAPTVTRFELNAEFADPDDLPSGEQPTTWAVQRSEIFNIQIELSEDLDLDVDDIVLTNLGRNPSVDPDLVIPLIANQFDLTGNVVTLTFDYDEISNGAYELRIASTVSDAFGHQFDGDGDGTGGDEYVISGNTSNGFYRMKSDFNGDGGTSVFDFSTFSYWFGTSTPRAPYYADMNGDEGVSVFDFSHFSTHFGFSVTLPPPALVGRSMPLQGTVEMLPTESPFDEVEQTEPNIRLRETTNTTRRRDPLELNDAELNDAKLNDAEDEEGDGLEDVLDVIAQFVALRWT
jgi:hypothetical protein